MANPWFKFYPDNWRADPALRLCGLSARGLWIEMLQIMHTASPRGHLIVGDTHVGAEELSALVGIPLADVEMALAELENKRVFSRKKNGVIFSRKMERDEYLSRKRRENGKQGGNPSLCKTIEKKGLVNQGDKPQKPEARSQKREEHRSVTVSDHTGTDFLKGKTAKTWLWSNGVDHLIQTTDKSTQQAKSAIGHLLKLCGEDPEEAVGHFIAALNADAPDIIGHCKAHIQIKKIPNATLERPEQVRISVFDDAYPQLAKRHEAERGKRPMQVQSVSWFPKSWVEDLARKRGAQ